MDQEQYYVDFMRSGGLAGASTSVEIDSSNLSLVDAELLKLLIDRSGFFEAFVSSNTLLNMPDQFRYHITIEHMGKRRTLELSDESIPDFFRPLINHLVHLARTRKKNQ